jgi:hypothetical protein
MACECLDILLEKLVETKKEQNPDWTINEANYLNKSWNFSDKGNPINLYNEIKLTYTFVKVDGSTSKQKSEKIPIYGNYCCFCGKLFKEETNGENTEQKDSE